MSDKGADPLRQILNPGQSASTPRGLILFRVTQIIACGLIRDCTRRRHRIPAGDRSESTDLDLNRCFCKERRLLQAVECGKQFLFHDRFLQHGIEGAARKFHFVTHAELFLRIPAMGCEQDERWS